MSIRELLHQYNPFTLAYPDNNNILPFASKVTDSIHIGNIYDSFDIEFIHRENIGAIINVMGPFCIGELVKEKITLTYSSVIPGILYAQFPLSQPFGSTINMAHSAVNLLARFQCMKLCTLIHCLSGRDRSVSIVWRYLTINEGRTDAEEMIKAVRPFGLVHKDWWG